MAAFIRFGPFQSAHCSSQLYYWQQIRLSVEQGDHASGALIIHATTVVGDTSSERVKVLATGLARRRYMKVKGQKDVQPTERVFPFAS